MSESYTFAVTKPTQESAKPDDAHELKHHLKGGKGFQNPWDSYQDHNALYMARHILGRKISGSINTPDPTAHTLTVQKPSFHTTRTPSPASGPTTLRATWLGHAAFYLEFPSGLRVLTDPVFADHCSPVKVKQFRRVTPPACQIEELPFVDVVVISHNHYDHLCHETVMRIWKKFGKEAKGKGVVFFVPLGVAAWFRSCGIPTENVVELDWWEERALELRPGVGEAKDVESKVEEQKEKKPITATVSALPCQHGSARGPFDRCKTLWSSWSIESEGQKVYFAGDTGYRTIPYNAPADTSTLPHNPAFAQVGALRGPFHLGLIPIGAYAPRFLFSSLHADADDAVSIFKDTRCERAVGMHWGTWILTEEEVMEPKSRLAEVCAREGVSTFGVLDLGGAIDV